ncbi:hypothetical protein G6M86_28365 (plasmid) [Agrobacterium tumefaciens]|uniref:Uncharacterized protein n=1 Tax=Agrobacterium tumefaciens TaxID=358 RepID=A0AAJ4N8M0_AGRTU|nr:hypothetical protein G6M86_28365 [Agrobacterium tumefaciens]
MATQIQNDRAAINDAESKPGAAGDYVFSITNAVIAVLFFISLREYFTSLRSTGRKPATFDREIISTLRLVELSVDFH